MSRSTASCRRRDAPTRTLEEPLPWKNSTLLKGDAGDAVRELKAGHQDLVVLGSGDLIRTLMRHDLIDEYLVLIHPLVLGTGRRLFENGAPPANLKLVDTNNTTTGVIIARYVPEGANAESDRAGGELAG